jgi:hypothetical protein
MDDELFWLNVLFCVVIVAAILLIIVSLASLGKQLGDVEYQKAMGINGIRRLQSNINIRKHVGRALLGFVFFSISFITFTDLPIMLRMWVSRLELLILLMYMAYACVADWIGEYKQLQILIKSTPVAGLSKLRLQAHALEDIVLELRELSTELSPTPVVSKQLILLDDVNAGIKNLQKFISERDPTFKYEKLNKYGEE